MPAHSHPRAPLVPAEAARRLLLHGQGLLARPERRATPDAVARQVERMGFVQVDTIQVIERAHHHVLATRFDDYRPAILSGLLERSRRLFEHWTHDASVLPMRLFPYWHRRFERARRTLENPRWQARMGGEPERVLAAVQERIRREGALRSRDFEEDRAGRPGGWWSWKRSKAALEALWRTGELAVARRDGFDKVYDLTERVIPDAHRTGPVPTPDLVDWACRSALERLGMASALEIRQFWELLSIDEVKAWCERAESRGEIDRVEIGSLNGTRPREAYGLAGWRRRLARLPDAPDRVRLLNPFDPVLRDRARTARLFGFDYSLEVFIPQAKRRFGYYVLPILEGERLIGRLDPKLHRDRGVLEVRGLWWEPGVAVGRQRRRALEGALDRMCQQLGAERFELPVDGAGARRTQPSRRARSRARSAASSPAKRAQPAGPP
ncbi:MAG: winged helix-turn-helix domain-containing protein [Myxococcota bacterium]